MAGYGLKAFIIVQDLTQLQKAYGKEESITSNCHIRIAFAPNKIETARMLSDMSGKTTLIQRKRSQSRQPGQLSRSEEHTSELQSLMRISYAVFCLKKKNTTNHRK